MSSGVARLQVLAAALLFSTGGAAIKAEAFTGLQISALRSGIAALVLILLIRGRLVLSWAMVITGAVYASTLTLFVLSTKLTTSANAIFLQSTAPLYLLVLGPILLGERFRKRDLIFFLSVASGLVMCVLGRPESTAIASNPRMGNLLAILSGVAWAFTLLGLRYIQRAESRIEVGMTAVIVGNLFASVPAWPFAWPLPSATTGDWATVVYLGVCQIALAYVFLTRAMRVLPALDISLLLLIEPVLNPLWTWVIRGENPGAWTIAGGSVIVAATAVNSLWDARADTTRVIPPIGTAAPRPRDWT